MAAMGVMASIVLIFNSEELVVRTVNKSASDDTVD